jgi:hypothetical protein
VDAEALAGHAVSPQGLGWGEAVADWADTPDLWAVDADQMPDAANNSLFTKAEQDEIAYWLTGVTVYARESLELSESQLAIDNAVDELKDASTRIGRKDWRLMFIGAFVTLGLEHVLEPGVVETLMRLATQGLAGVFGAHVPPMITT